MFQLALTEESSSLHDEPICSNYSMLLNTVPKGRAEAPHTLLGSANDITECVQLCCNKGKTCEIAWLFQGQCYSVSCTNVNKESCKPDTVRFHSVYLWIHREDTPTYNENDTSMNNEDDMLINNEDDTPMNNEHNSVTDNDSLDHDSHITTNHGDDLSTDQHNDYDSDANQDIFTSTGQYRYTHTCTCT